MSSKQSDIEMKILNEAAENIEQAERALKVNPIQSDDSLEAIAHALVAEARINLASSLLYRRLEEHNI